MVEISKGEKLCSTVAKSRDKIIGERPEANIKVTPVTPVNHPGKELKFITVETSDALRDCASKSLSQ